MLYRTDDPEADFLCHDAAQVRYEERLPHCEYCEKALYDTYYCIDGEILCEKCVEKNFKYDVDTYID
jgi:hypothetical protein